MKADGTVEPEPNVNEQVAWGIQQSIAGGRTDGEIHLGGGSYRHTLYWNVVDVIGDLTGRPTEAPKPKPKSTPKVKANPKTKPKPKVRPKRMSRT